MSKLTKGELDAMPAKTKKDPRVVQMYLDNDFLRAYAMHTDLRVEENGPEGAVGAVKDWERHGELQFEYLKLQGLKPQHRLLEVGCGTGRLARKVVPYLDEGCYEGVDISPQAINSAIALSGKEGWNRKRPGLSTVMPNRFSSDRCQRFRFAWAFSVFIHLPYKEMVRTMSEVAFCMDGDGVFLFSFVPESVDVRTGLKQFRHTLASYTSAVRQAGFSHGEEAQGWNAEQRIMRCTL
jgi:SAM-dependent methyltransferase